MANAPTVLPLDAAASLIERAEPLLLDARDPHSYRQAHIDGAMLLHDGLLESLISRKDFDRPILIYCYRGVASMDKAKLFAAAGFRRVFSLEGGFVAWTRRAKEASAAGTNSALPPSGG